jgi:hypothetical protein
MTEPAALCRELLDRVAVIERLRAIRDEFRAMEQWSLAGTIPPAIRREHGRIARLSYELGLPPMTLTRDAAAFARAQLGLPIDAPAANHAARRRRPQTSAWQRDLATATGARP